MRVSKTSETANPAGSPKVRDTTLRDYKRSDFFRDLKKVAKKQDRPSQPGSKTR